MNSAVLCSKKKALKTEKRECKCLTFGCSDQVTADSVVFNHSAENLCFHKYQEIRKKKKKKE